MQKVLKHWHGLSREVVNAPPLEVLKTRLDGDLGSLIWWMVTSPVARVLKLDNL